MKSERIVGACGETGGSYELMQGKSMLISQRVQSVTVVPWPSTAWLRSCALRTNPRGLEVRHQVTQVIDLYRVRLSVCHYNRLPCGPKSAS